MRPLFRPLLTRCLVHPRAYLTAQPLQFGYAASQAHGIAWMKAALQRVAAQHPLPDVERALRFYDRLARTTSIQSRTSCLEDFTHFDWNRMRLFSDPSLGDGQASEGMVLPWYRPPLETRMDVFAETALALAEQAFIDDTEAPDLLVQVSCTGYDSPTAVQRVAIDHGWVEATRVLHIGHMGCYAALPAVALAADAVQAHESVLVGNTQAEEGEARASILLVELCTLHHNPEATDVEQIVQQCLFADGAARVDVTSKPGADSFGLLGHAETIIPESLGGMTWRVADSAFQMTLSREVPKLIQAHLAPVMRRFLQSHGLAVDDVRWWAVHPGGPRVIESTAEALNLPDDSVRHSQQVLAERGNMSSTTLPHIWAAMADDEAVASGDLVASVAFGPGLTVAMNLLQRV